jgi:hypothetical protein
MKLCQQITIDDQGQHSLSLLSGPTPAVVPHYVAVGPYDFSFHPFLIQSYVSGSTPIAQDSSTPLNFCWELAIIEEQREQNALAHLSASSAMLLLSEFSLGLHEIFQALEWHFSSLDVAGPQNCLRLNGGVKAEVPLLKILGQAWVFSLGIDSLLFARGLKRESHSFRLNGERLETFGCGPFFQAALRV